MQGRDPAGVVVQDMNDALSFAMDRDVAGALRKFGKEDKQFALAIAVQALR